MPYKPSLRAFVFGLRSAINGVSVGDKARLIIVHILNTLIRIPIFRIRGLIFIRELIATRTFISFGGAKYSPRDNFNVLSYRHEPWIWNYLKLKRGDVFVDVGAHIGKYVVWAANIVKEEGRVIAIEPEPRNYEVLIKNVTMNKLKNVIALNYAAWNKDCEVKLYMGYDSEGHSIKGTGHEWIPVKARKLDSLLREHKLSKVSLIKIDVEGAELEVLQGLKNTLKSYGPRLIIEVFRRNLSEVVKFLREYGYRYHIIPNSGFANAELGIHIFAEPAS